MPLTNLSANPFNNRRLRLLAIALPLLLSACQSYRDVDGAAAQAQLPLTTQFAAEGRISAEQPVAQWWAQLQDAQLDKLIATALAHNHDIRIAAASLEESRALLRQARANRLPTLDARVGGQRDKVPEAFAVGRPQAIMETWQAGFDTAWEVDLFEGRLGNAVQLGRAQAQAREADLHAIQVSIAAEVATTYIALRGNQYLLQVARSNAGVQQQTHELTRTLEEVGQGDTLDVARAEAQLALTEAQIPALEAEVQVSLNRLGVLTGQGKGALDTTLAEPRSLPGLPAMIGVGQPLDLLRRRPDIRSAEALLRGSVAEYNIAVADLYPRIVFTGSLGYLASDWSDLGRSETQTFAFAPALQWGGLNQGRAQARIAAADARTTGQLAVFEQRVLRALEETASALERFTQEEARRLRLLAAAQASTQAASFARERFELGSGDFLNVLDAQRSQLDVDAQLAQSETQLLLNLVAIYRVLGGGWETAQ